MKKMKIGIERGQARPYDDADKLINQQFVTYE
jgi:hypothetical protein